MYLFPYFDFSVANEVRFLLMNQQCRRHSLCCRGDMADLQHAYPDIEALAQWTFSQLPAGNYLIDIAHFPNGAIALVEINPALTRAEIMTLQNARPTYANA